MTGVHRQQHVERLGPADLADNDPSRSHAQGVADQVADADLAHAFHVLAAGLECNAVRQAPVQLQLRYFFHRDHAFVEPGDRGAQRVQQGGLA